MTGSTSSLAHSRRSDYGEDAKRCEQEKQRGGGGVGVVGKGERAEERSLFFSLLSPGFKFPPSLTSVCTGYRLQATGCLSTLSAPFAYFNHDEAFAVISHFTLPFIEDSLYSSISKMIQMLRSGYISGVR